MKSYFAPQPIAHSTREAESIADLQEANRNVELTATQLLVESIRREYGPSSGIGLGEHFRVTRNRRSYHARIFNGRVFLHWEYYNPHNDFMGHMVHDVAGVEPLPHDLLQSRSSHPAVGLGWMGLALGLAWLLSHE